MSAAQALALGLVGELQPPHRVLIRAQELAARIAEHSPTALARSKRAIWESLDTGLHEGLDRAWKIIQEHVAHPDLEEGSRAFVEKRKPRWAPYTGE
jgi:enoyl-CoA hydratase/carnithine racemase